MDARVAAHDSPASRAIAEAETLAVRAARARRTRDLLSHLALGLGVVVFAFPVYMALIGSTHDAATIGRGDVPLLPGSEGAANYDAAWNQGGMGAMRTPASVMMWNSFVMALAIALGKIAISVTSAYAVAFFRFPGRMLLFWSIFLTLMLPVEVRIIPTFQVVSSLNMVNTHAGLIIPLIASATATLLFRQFFLTIPDELVEAAKIDGAGPLRFFWDVVLPLSVTNIAALFVILFIYGWNQYLWPLLITTSQNIETILIGITKMISSEGATEWNMVMATAMLALIPPVAVVILMQRWFVRGLVDTEK